MASEQYCSILHTIKAHAENTPGKLCAGDKKRQVTYREFWLMLQRAASFLRRSGIGSGTVVSIRACQKLEYLVALLGVQLAGGIACPLEKAIKDLRIIEIMNFVDSSVCIAEKPVMNASIHNLSLGEVFQQAENAANDIIDFTLPKGPEPSEILFTTGTTGKSKGIEVSFATNVCIAQNVLDSVSMASDEVELITTPASHSLAIRRVYGALYNGSSLVLTDGVKFLDDFFEMLDRYQVTAITFVPAILEQLLKYGGERFSTYKSQLNYIQIGSAPLPETSKKTLSNILGGVRLYNTYGSTESACTAILEFSRYPDKKNCIGRLTVNSTILFVDEERNLVEATPDSPGYLAFSGGMNMMGYYREPELTAEVLDENGIVYTNDLGYCGKDGLIYLLGRKGDVINMGGIKVAPTEIEEVAMQCSMVKDCACVPVPDEITGEAIKLFLSLNEECQFNQKELTKFLLDRLEALKVPKIYEVIEKIPRTFNGKIVRKELKERENRQ